MLFAIDIAAMNGSEDVLDRLDRVLMRAEEGAHDLEIIAESLEQSAWFVGSRGARRESIRAFAQRSIYRGRSHDRGPHQRKESVTDAESARQAAALANTPLEVITENDVSDGALVEFAVRLLATKETVELCFGAPSRLLDPPAFRIESRGGHGPIPDFIERRHREAIERQRPMRIIVVTDGDGEWPGDVKPHAIEIRRICAERQVPCPPLDKRTAENYIPDAYWRRMGDGLSGQSVKPLMDALLSLSTEQRDHIKMDSGKKSPWDANKPEVQQLFADVSESVQAKLAKGRFKTNGDAMHIELLAKHANTYSLDDLCVRDHAGDLAVLVRCIEEQL